MTRIIVFNKPYLVLCQFTDAEGRPTLADYIPLKGIYPAGRLDYDSEGLVVLTNSGRMQFGITDPENKLLKVYWVQVEGEAGEEALDKLRKGVMLKDGLTRPAQVKRIPEPLTDTGEALWERTPPIRFRKEIPTSWLELKIIEGRKRQVRRMTAAVGLPTLRLVRYAVGDWRLGKLKPGEWKEMKPKN